MTRDEALVMARHEAVALDDAGYGFLDWGSEDDCPEFFFPEEIVEIVDRDGALDDPERSEGDRRDWH